MYPETINWCKKITTSYPNEQMEALYLIACSHYNMFDIESCLRHLTEIWNLSDNQFETDYLNDKRFKHMFTNIAHLSKNNRQQEE